ncbi:DNA internalization-related competence protein ComEC/Rec2 [uncultured Methylophaga sp.]|uniref:DNA internalization-related competence protein ComEC/Rec2 n=1 Tax=uncultured Methylophaga sp. TaxID=285271 RepID=UPI002624950E|nr:DNA internalization-related competence protein ComEC/Rec2 [uncultured Methylophaga sp.]
MIKTAIAFLLVCVLCLHLSNLPSHGWLLILLLPVLFWFRQLLIASFIVGLLWAGFQAQWRLDDRLSPALSGEDITTTGMIASLPEQHEQVLRFNFKPDSETLPDKIRLSWYHHNGSAPRAGERWQFTVRLKPPRGMMNPGGFDYEKWLFSEGIGATGYIRQHNDNQLLATAPDWHLNRLRQNIIEQISLLTPNATQLPLLLGLSTGQRDELTASHWEVLRQTGTSHLLAISGLHIGLAAALGFFLFRWGWSLSLHALSWLPARQAGAIGGFIFALSYALLAGMAVPTQRALIMVSTVMLALCLKRPLYPSHVLAFSLLMVLVYDPMSVLSAGFWLSFSAVALILLTCSGRFPPRRGNWAWIHLWLAVGLLPMLVLFFGEFSLIAPLANILAVPMVSLLIVPLILLAMLMMLFSQTLASWLLMAADLLLSWLWHWLKLLAALPFADWQLSSLPLSLSLLMMLLVILLLLPRGVPGKSLCLLLILPIAFYQPARPAEGHLHFSLLDVGQGLAAVIETRRHTLVFDTGPRYSARFNTGSAVVAPFLQSRGITEVDRLIVSHGDNDHIGGVEGLKQHIVVADILTSDRQALTDARICEAGQQWQWDGVQFDILLPGSNQSGSDNDRSCVLQVRADNIDVLLPGDIEKDSEQRLLRSYGSKLNSDILVVPHHGSATSSGMDFIQAVDPHYALFAVGYRNRYQFPKKRVVARYQQQGSVIMRTDYDGALLFDGSAQPIRWRRQRDHLWTAGTTE